MPTRVKQPVSQYHVPHATDRNAHCLVMHATSITQPPIESAKAVNKLTEGRRFASPPSTRRQYFRFVFAAGLSVPVNLASRALFSTFVRYEVAVLLAHVVGMVTAYTLTRIFVFERSGRSVEVELARFALVNVVSASITWVISVSLVYQVFPRIGWTLAPEFIAHLTGLGCSSIFSFLGHRQFSFRRAAAPAER